MICLVVIWLVCSMLILGDIATFKEKVLFQYYLEGEVLLVNCEGFLVNTLSNNSPNVFNNVKFYINLSQKMNLIMNLSNNHTMDIPTGVSQSLALAKQYNLNTVGAGKNLDDACKPYRCKEKNTNISIISAGWDIIGCKPATSYQEGVAPIGSTRLIKQVIEEKALGNKVVVYLHWDYELEIYPQPTHRNLARQLIECGADLIVGCHSHCLQGFEKYNDKYIFYGVGNTIFDEGYYFNGKLKFPDFCKVGLAVKWNSDTDKILVAKTHYKNDMLVFSDFIKPEDDNDLMKLSTFSRLNQLEYIEFFKINRRKKNLLPIFYEEDTTLSYKLKKFFLNIRAFVIKKMFLIGLKGHSR